MTRKAAETGPGAMVLVAIEQGFPESERIVIDPLAGPILPLKSRISVGLCRPIRNWIVAKTEQKVPGLWGSIMSRKRYFDEAVAEAAANSVTAVVNLGAGFDTRSFRLPELRSLPVWEVDQTINVEAKRRRLQSVIGSVPANVALVPIDFDREDLAGVLAEHGYAGNRETCFIWEGVTQYLDDTGIRTTLEYLAAAPSGSRLLFTYTPKDFIDGEVFYGHKYLYRQMREKDQVWLTGFNPHAIESFVGEYGWEVVEHLGYDQLHERYVRPTGRDLGWMAIERIVHARKQ